MTPMSSKMETPKGSTPLPSPCAKARCPGHVKTWGFSSRVFGPGGKDPEDAEVGNLGECHEHGRWTWVYFIFILLTFFFLLFSFKCFFCHFNPNCWLEVLDDIYSLEDHHLVGWGLLGNDNCVIARRKNSLLESLRKSDVAWCCDRGLTTMQGEKTDVTKGRKLSSKGANTGCTEDLEEREVGGPAYRKVQNCSTYDQAVKQQTRIFAELPNFWQKKGIFNQNWLTFHHFCLWELSIPREKTPGDGCVCSLPGEHGATCTARGTATAQRARCQAGWRPLPFCGRSCHPIPGV